MLSCREVVQELNNQDISFQRKAELELHLKFCQCCESYQKHLAFIKSSVAALVNQIRSLDPRTESELEQLEEKIISRVQQSHDK